MKNKYLKNSFFYHYSYVFYGGASTARKLKIYLCILSGAARVLATGVKLADGKVPWSRGHIPKKVN